MEEKRRIVKVPPIKSYEETELYRIITRAMWKADKVEEWQLKYRIDNLRTSLYMHGKGGIDWEKIANIINRINDEAYTKLAKNPGAHVLIVDDLNNSDPDPKGRWTGTVLLDGGAWLAVEDEHDSEYGNYTVCNRYERPMLPCLGKCNFTYVVEVENREGTDNDDVVEYEPIFDDDEYEDEDTTEPTSHSETPNEPVDENH